MIGNGYIYTEHGRSEEVKQKEARGGCNGATGIWEGGGPLLPTWHPYHCLNTVKYYLRSSN